MIKIQKHCLQFCKGSVYLVLFRYGFKTSMIFAKSPAYFPTNSVTDWAGNFTIPSA
jgi:hypothetical protein